MIRLARLRTALTAVVMILSVTGGTGAAQIAVDTLDPAARFDAGVLPATEGGLGPNLWQGTSAKRASWLIEQTANAKSSSAQTLLRAALLSGGTPPTSASESNLEDFQDARLAAALKLTSLENYDFIAERTSTFGNNKPLVQSTDRSLLDGDTNTACQTANMVTEGRSAPYWAKLRAFCHYLADELPAMEVTIDLLRKNGDKDTGFFTLIGVLSGTRTGSVDGALIQSPLHFALAGQLNEAGKLKPDNLPPQLLASLAMSPDNDPAMRLTILTGAADILTPTQIQSLWMGMNDIAAQSPDALPATGRWKAKDWGGAYLALRETRDIAQQAGWLSAILQEADAVGILMPVADALAGEITIMPYQYQVGASAPVYIKIAINKGDLGALRGLYEAMSPENALRPRIALASDAIGNGFTLSDLGVTIEHGLRQSGDVQARAIRDVYIATGLGANLSQSAYEVLSENNALPGMGANNADLLALKAASMRGSQAEAALWAAKIFGNNEITAMRADVVSQILTLLSDAGMSTLAGSLAAQDFMSETL